jgi:hypothetical protein
MKNIATALLNFHKEIGKISKDSSNPFFKSKYASLSNILSAIKEPLNKSNLVIVQVPTESRGLRTVIMHTESGEMIEGTATMLIVKDDIQGQGSAITYMRRYALGSMLGLNIDDDDDGNIASTKQAPKPAYQKPVVKPVVAKPQITEEEFKTAIKKMLENSTIKPESKAPEVKKFLEMKFTISKEYEDKIESEIFAQVFNS